MVPVRGNAETLVVGFSIDKAADSSLETSWVSYAYGTARITLICDLVEMESGKTQLTKDSSEPFN
jgi:hypothetical protein